MNTVPFSTRLKPSTKKKLDDYCKSYKTKKGKIINKFDIVDDAIINEVARLRSEEK